MRKNCVTIAKKKRNLTLSNDLGTVLLFVEKIPLARNLFQTTRHLKGQTRFYNNN